MVHHVHATSPELVQNQAYTEKADVWAAGCLLYQMATLCHPFHSPNLLQLAQQVMNTSCWHHMICWYYRLSNVDTSPSHQTNILRDCLE